MIIKNAKIYTMTDNNVIEKGDILIKDGLIKSIGTFDETEYALEEIIDAKGMVVLPGIIEPHCHIGGADYSVRVSSDELNEKTSNLTPELNPMYSINVDSKDFEGAYKNGITTVCVAPGSGNVVGGEAVVLKTYGNNVFDMVIRKSAALKAAMGGNPKRQYGNKNQSPMTRMAVADVLSTFLEKAKNYYDKKKKGEVLEINDGYEAALELFDKKIPLKVHCTQFDTLTVIEIAKKYDIRLTLDHAWGCKDYIDIIKDSGHDVIFGPIGGMRLMGESRDIHVEDVKELDEKGVNVTLMTDAPVYSIASLIDLAGEVVRTGCPIERVLKMLTINAAKALGVDDKIGSIEPGKDADIVIFNGIPAFHTNAKLMFTIVDGKLVYKNNF